MLTKGTRTQSSDHTLRTGLTWSRDRRSVAVRSGRSSSGSSRSVVSASMTRPHADRRRAQRTFRPVGEGSLLELLGTFLAELREFSLDLTELVDLVQGDRFSSNAEVLVLITLDLDGPRRPSALARAAGLTTGGMTNLLDRLEAAALVRRAGPVGGDRRGVKIEVTEAGTAFIDLVARSVSIAFSLAAATMERWRDIFHALGYDVGELRTSPGDRRSDLERIRALAAIGAGMWSSFGDVFGPDDPQPVSTFHVLWIVQRDGGARPRRIAAAEHLSSAGTSDLLKRLEGAGLIERGRGIGRDGRAVTVTITDDGRRSLDAAIQATESTLERFAALLFLA